MKRALWNLLYRYRFIASAETQLPPGLGVIMQETTRLTGRASYWFRFADETVWRRIPIANLGLISTCRDAQAVRDLCEVTR